MDCVPSAQSTLPDTAVVTVTRRQVLVGVVAAFGEDVDQHCKSQRIVEDWVLRVDQRYTGNGMPQNDRHHLLFNK